MQNEKTIITNADDLGLDCGSNEAFLELSKFGSIKSGSVMVPCPWFRQICDLYKNNPILNIGVHLTLTSEWQNYRWRPLSTNKTASGLIDSDGYFWKNRYLLRKNVNKKAAEIELRAQINTAIKAGLDITHLDCHMGIGIMPELIEIYIKLGYEYGLPVLLPRKIEKMLKIYKIEDSWLPFYKNIIHNLEKDKYPLIDYFRITPCFKSKTALSGYKQLLSTTNKGITFISLHPSKNGTIASIDPIKYQIRIDEYNIFKSNFDLKWTKSQGIRTSSYRELRNQFRKNLEIKKIKNE
jgi:hypothetical protein